MNDGGPAFPGKLNNCYDPPRNEGMSLRDWFAGQALVGLRTVFGTLETYEKLAAWAYEDADAMLLERNKREEE